ncbi:DUF4864 domain-containing protein [Ramlibacter tataouinensis]|uniref:DUF4864 domain-containing protein n=1 Tax=Ramlibacter tataouinensis (strain ATCC BAA-407 / DSM 14655 / LMG 21543 / TTB310) TaxID=365046 RepID=F5Y526_RAMTT|nr:DUF4864 domain-containing protein [Ramlibacter tataouinensis]AEG93866.1 Conserved hypothetical protein [Ramlibacter tataouinensis TTB310]
MNLTVIRFFNLIVMALLATALHAQQADLVAEEDAEKVRQVIVTQLDALSQDDADRAFATTTPSVRAALGSSGRFLAMVRGAYPMVYRPSSVSFHKPEKDEETVLQLVEIKDSDAKSWLVVFALEQQPDRSWRISGCLVAENRWQTI